MSKTRVHTGERWSVNWRPGERDFLVEPEGDDSMPLVVVRPRLAYGEDGRLDAELVAKLIASALEAGLTICEDCSQLIEGQEGTRCVGCAADRDPIDTTSLYERLEPGARVAIYAALSPRGAAPLYEAVVVLEPEPAEAELGERIEGVELTPEQRTASVWVVPIKETPGVPVPIARGRVRRVEARS